MLKRCALRNGNVHSADGWKDVLNPVIARYAERKLRGRFFRADAAYAILAMYQRLEDAGYFYAIRLPANAVLREKTAHRLTRPVGRPPKIKVKRFHEDFEYQAQSWDKPRRVIARIEWHPGELFPRAASYTNRWDTACRRFRDNEVGLQLHALAYDLATFLYCIELPEDMADWSLASLQLKLIKIGARMVRHDRAITSQMVDVAVTDPMVRAILSAIQRPRAPPSCA